MQSGQAVGAHTFPGEKNPFSAGRQVASFGFKNWPAGHPAHWAIEVALAKRVVWQAGQAVGAHELAPAYLPLGAMSH
jgi:hypothetical protein